MRQGVPNLKLLDRLCQEAVALRRGDYRTERLNLDWARLTLRRAHLASLSAAPLPVPQPAALRPLPSDLRPPLSALHQQRAATVPPKTTAGGPVEP